MTATTVPAPAPAAGASLVWKGAWGGAWLVFYGCFTLLVRFGWFAYLDVISRGLATLGATLRLQAEKNTDIATPAQFAEMFERAGPACGATQRPLYLGAAAVSAVLVVLGFLVLRRSETARKLALATLAASLAVSLAIDVHTWVRVLPLAEEWSVGFVELFESTARLASQDSKGMTDLVRSMTNVSRVQQAVLQLFGLGLHLGALIPLWLRLAGAPSREWCSEDAAAATR